MNSQRLWQRRFKTDSNFIRWHAYVCNKVKNVFSFYFFLEIVILLHPFPLLLSSFKY